jgi:hypothetical protein
MIKNRQIRLWEGSTLKICGGPKWLVHTWAGRVAALLIALLAATSCSPIRGYPNNFQDNDETIARLKSASEDARSQYNSATDSGVAKTLRNRVVYNEMQICEIYFTDFQARLWADNNLFSTGSDLIVLILAGLGATTGDAAAKSALAAASAGIVGAKGAISKDIYYQRTLPAILAQMSANRDKVKAAIIDNLNKKDDTQYPLSAAEMDLQALQRASGIVDAVQSITNSATLNKDMAAALVEAARQGTFSKSINSQRIRAWIGFGIDPTTGKAYTPNPTNMNALQKWVDEHLPGLPVAQLLTDAPSAQLENSRAQAIRDLNIP